MMMERSGSDRRKKEKLGEWDPRQSQTDREGTPQERCTIDQQLDNDHDNDDNLDFESTMARIKNNRCNGNTTNAHNKFQALQLDDDSDDDSETVKRDECTTIHNATIRTRGPNLNKRQRQRRREAALHRWEGINCNEEDEKVRDAAACEEVDEADWHMLSSTTTLDKCTNKQKHVSFCEQHHPHHPRNYRRLFRYLYSCVLLHVVS